jgi:hypothetical protein
MVGIYNSLTEYIESEKITKDDLFKKTIVTDNCWIWKGGGGWKDYPILGQWGIPARRIFYYLFNNEDPGTRCVRKSCQSINCVRPDHLFIRSLNG